MNSKNRRFVIHISGTIAIVGVISFISYIFFNIKETPFFISFYLLGLSILFWFNQEDDRINSFLLSIFFQLLFMEGFFMGVGIFYDFIHIPIIITDLYIIIRVKPVKFRYILYATILYGILFFILVITGLAYNFVITIIFDGMVFTFWFILATPLIEIVSLIIFYIIINKKIELKW